MKLYTTTLFSKMALGLFLMLGCYYNSIATTARYRLTYRDDPSTTIVVGFDAVSSSNHTVYYGLTDGGKTPGNYSFSKTVDRQTTYRGMKNCFVRITGLLPKTRYYFIVVDGNSKSDVMYFETVTDDPNDKISFVAGGDSRSSSSSPEDAIEWGNEMVKKLKPDAVLFGGDMTNDDTNSEWIDWFNKWQLTFGDDGRVTPILATQGNHESGPAVIVNLFDTPDQDSDLSGNHAYYGITFAGGLARSYTLNSDEKGIISDQADWLESDLIDNANVVWKMAQYHQPIAPHKTGKDYRTDLYSNWADLFYTHGVRLAIECDAHVVKETDPVKPTGNTSDSNKGFKFDAEGTYYAGEGTWRALRSVDVSYPFTRVSGSFNQVKWIIVSKNEMELRTVKTKNVDAVSEVSENDRFTPPSGLEVWNNEATIISRLGAPVPQIQILNPLVGNIYSTPQVIPIAANVTDLDGTITEVNFYVNDQLIGSKFGAPYVVEFDFDAFGDYEITIEAFDNDGQENTKSITLTIDEQVQVNTNCILNDEFSDESTLFAFNASTGFQVNAQYGKLDISSVGHSQYAKIHYEFNNGTAPELVNLDLNSPPVLRLRVKASSPCLLRTTLRSGNITAQNSPLKKINEIELSKEYRIIEINFEGHLWDAWVNKDSVFDQTALSHIVFSINHGYTGNPQTGASGNVYDDQFIGTINIDWIRFGQNCTDCYAIPNGIGVSDSCGVCYMPVDYMQCLSTGIDDNKITNTEIVWPTVFDNQTALHTSTLGEGPFYYQVSNMSGALLEKGVIAADDVALIGEQLRPGMYMISLINNTNIWTTKVIKRE